MDIESFQIALGKKIKKIREGKGYTLEDLEFYTDIDSSDLNKIELGKRNITIKTLLKLSQGLEVHPKVLLDVEIQF